MSCDEHVTRNKIKENFLDVADVHFRNKRTNKLSKVTDSIMEMNLNKKMGINDQKEFLEREISKQFKFYQTRGYAK